MTTKPTRVFKDGALSIAYWEDLSKNSSSKKVVFRKRYRTKDGEWKTTNSLFLNEIPKAVSLLERAYKELNTEESVQP